MAEAGFDVESIIAEAREKVGLGHAPDPLEIGNQVLDRYARAAERRVALRETIPEERIVGAAMRAWVAKNPREHRPPREYTAEQLGLTRERIERACRRHRARFVA